MRQHRSGRFSVNLPPGFPVVSHLHDPGVPEDTDIELCRFLGLVIKPQARRDPVNPWHDVLSLLWLVTAAII
jgi:hypothetical protein